MTTTEATTEDLVSNVVAVVDGLTEAARRATVVRDQAIDIARSALRHLEAGRGPRSQSPSVVALRGQLDEIAGRAATLTALDEVTAALALLPPGAFGIDAPEPTTAAELADVLPLHDGRSR